MTTHDEGFAKGYQAALDDLLDNIGNLHYTTTAISMDWLNKKIQELKEKQNDRT